MRSTCILAALSMLLTTGSARGQADLERAFRDPPDSARPWVYWFWLNGNLSRQGITADLEAMKRVGIGGVLIMEVDQGTPKGPFGFGKPEWRELFKHVCVEAERLGLEVNMNNDAGWCGSGGPWITPELAMQKLVWTETAAEGGKKFESVLPQAKAVANYYRDITVIAFPATTEYRIAEIAGKAAFTTVHLPPKADWPAAPPGAAIARDRVLDITAKMQADGKLTWDVPEGPWTIVRIGHTPTGKDNHPAPLDGRGLECDKLSKKGAQAMFDGLMGKLIADVGPRAGKTLVSTHIDSWEVGSQNWTAGFREEFQKRRGYDMWPFLPVTSGRVVDSLEVSERFLWDLRMTINDLMHDNYTSHFRDLAHKNGLRLSIEAYDNNPCEDLAYAGRCDEPMAEFWSWQYGNFAWACTEMASAAHIYGKRILGAEVFTATDAEKWQGHPGFIKSLGDWALCEGINRFVFHRYAMQPWPDRRPGMSMGPWGLHYERSQTWWEQSAAWHRYLARCQYMLREGLFVADVLYLQPEGSPMRFAAPAGVLKGNPPDRPRYNFDGCNAEVLMTRVTVKDGRLVLPDGMTYRVLSLSGAETMTPSLLRRIKELADAGATIVGNRPKKSPSLSDYPKCDADLAKMADELWNSGKVVAGKTAEQVLAEKGVKPDFSADRRVRFIHRQMGEVDSYFLANGASQAVEAVCEFRVTGKTPTFWRPETGTVERVVAFDEKDGVTRIPMQFGPAESVFVVFRPGSAKDADRVVSIAREGQEQIRWTVAAGGAATDAVNTFTMSVWVKPAATTTIGAETVKGVVAYNWIRNDVLYPPPGHEVFGDGQAGAGIAAGTNGVCVHEHGADYFSVSLAYPAEIKDWAHLAVVYRDGLPTLYVNGKLAKQGLKGPVPVHGGVDVPHGRTVAPFRGEMVGLEQFGKALTEEEIAKLAQTRPAPVVRDDTPEIDLQRGEVKRPGTYTVKTADGRTRQFAVAQMPAAVEAGGAWDVTFDPKWGGPEKAVFEKLEDWSARSEPGIKYYSGAATYRKTIAVSPELLGKDRRLYLDLGRVEVMAEVKLNGTNLGLLWHTPYRLDITDAAKAGDNAMEIRVVNLWINRQIGDEQLAEDSQRKPDGTLKEWPAWLAEDKPSPTGRLTFTSWRLWKKDSPLAPSGLIGPVTIRAMAKVNWIDPSNNQ